MPPPPRPFRLVYRRFARIEFDPAKNDEIFERRGFDLAYVSRLFPGYVLEREDTRGDLEPRCQVIGELLGDVFSSCIHAPSRLHAASSQHGPRNRVNASYGTISHLDEGNSGSSSTGNRSAPSRGQFDPTRFRRPNPEDREPRPEVSPEDAAATRAELEELKRRTRRKTA